MSVERLPRARLTDAEKYARDYQAVRYCLMVVGEALSQVPADILNGEPAIPWRRVIALRHRLVHAYWLIDEDLLVEIVRHETDTVIVALERLVEKIK